MEAGRKYYCLHSFPGITYVHTHFAYYPVIRSLALACMTLTGVRGPTASGARGLGVCHIAAVLLGFPYYSHCRPTAQLQGGRHSALSP
ncbi:hypothetical protein EDB86DRAFT_1331821 [Lactarius hatsudake]|nr:hypothetical protein EDB86DRAFT_1331821 [Lactarius hatsudake]